MWRANRGACKISGSNPTFRNSSTWPASGAPPLRMRLTRPPKRALIFEKTSLSKSGVACASRSKVGGFCLATPDASYLGMPLSVGTALGMPGS